MMYMDFVFECVGCIILPINDIMNFFNKYKELFGVSDVLIPSLRAHPSPNRNYLLIITCSLISHLYQHIRKHSLSIPSLRIWGRIIMSWNRKSKVSIRWWEIRGGLVHAKENKYSKIEKKTNILIIATYSQMRQYPPVLITPTTIVPSLSIINYWHQIPKIECKM